MLERRSALATAHPYRSSVLKIEEVPLRSLIQFAGGAKPKAETIFTIAPGQYWVVDSEVTGKGTITPLTSSRTRILLEGSPARDVLAKGIAIDWHDSVFMPGMFALTGVHHMPLAVHCTGSNSFHLYAMRTFAMSVYEWLTDAAREFADA